MINPITYHIQDVYSGVREFSGNFNSDASTLVIYPGSFNPLHEGHLALFKLAKKILGIEPIFEVCIKNFDKGKIDAKDMERRLYALQQYPYMIINASYFREKVQVLKEYFPDKKIVFVIGNDTWERIETKDWTFFESNNVKFLVFPRHGRKPDYAFFPKLLVYIDEYYFEDVRNIPNISSTEIRKNYGYSIN